MTFNSADAIVYTAFFLIPGFIISETINSIIPGKRRSDSEKALVYLGYSILNLGCWFWLFYLINGSISDKTALYWLLLIALVVCSGTITGCIIGVLKKYNPIRRFMKMLNIPVEHPIPTAWEYKFSQMNEGRYLAVCLNDDTMIRGSFYNKSIASSDIEKMDIYLEEAYLLEDKKWKSVEGSDGVWIASGAIKWISFFEEGGIPR